MYKTIFDDLFELNREMNRVFKSAGVTGKSNWPETNTYEKNDEYILVSKVPGIEKDDIEITLKDNSLTIKGKRKKEEGESLKKHLEERFSGNFERNFLLNNKIDAENIKAETSDGLLIIKLPKSAEMKPKKIEIK
eukprot:Anaeramoba_ignava/a218384_18.p2 GENE.a218384_18~~a218384_18.p2  ORF type:complete len:135 (-),score=24.01 a218384_18:377-781(-)